ncbi:energy transducer TonB [uncultured Sphingomonas sp.]|uniref:energy transducer TonB n=1 Tax=uncultured Sphingomonas sp. TaxID=158754 RepID=UPI0025ED4AA4|nr:energy transducer TonB [uncultured Sphingomonas sp.]
MAWIMLVALALGQAGEVPKGPLATPLKPKTAPSSWVTDADYPSSAVDKGKAGRVDFILTVDTTGTPDGCHITATSGYLLLDQHSCAILLKRARFSPARDPSGTPIRATYSNKFGWAASDGSTPGEIPRIDLIVDVAKLPAGYARPALTRVHFAKSGSPDACRVEVTSGVAAIDKVACAQVMLQAPTPTQGIKYGPIFDTRMVSVSFEQTPAK